ncbi:unnamed protein product [Ambrosiozyma monospora]|uniref:Unnamed protein product n=1 Tax=Ambrosiozyma monospora TaxID=43982 RepID=A0ACB5TFG3_AMBMO|nr:unnamed protein product [Ambrosiozyma monospora]
MLTYQRNALLLSSKSLRSVALCGQQRQFINLAGLAKSNPTASSTAQSYVVHKQFSHPQELIYELISSVDKYHEFIPYCTDSFIRGRDANGEPSIAGLRVGFQKFDEEFTCDLTCQKPSAVVAKSITHSLFYFLETEWTVHKVNDTHCKAVLNLKYEFKSTLYNKVSSLFARKVASLMTKAFEKRAYEVAKSRK